MYKVSRSVVWHPASFSKTKSLFVNHKIPFPIPASIGYYPSLPFWENANAFARCSESLEFFVLARPKSENSKETKLKMIRKPS